MPKIILYIAQSLDGFIADENGQVEWLENIPNPDQSDYGYQEFYDSIDTTIMGSNTYKQVTGFDIPFPYTGKKNYVLSRKKQAGSDEVEFIRADQSSFFKNLKNGTGKNIWLIGGSEVNTFFMKEGLLDELIVFTMPVLIGKGLPIFNTFSGQVHLDIIESVSYKSGVVMHHYRVKN